MNSLSLCWGSLEEADLPSLLAAASSAGFAGVTLNWALYLRARAAGLSDSDIGRALADHGLSVSNIDPLFNWLPGAMILPGEDTISLCTQASKEDVFRLAHIAGTDLVNAPLGLAQPGSEQEIVDGFGALCTQAAAEGLRVSLEFMPFNAVADLATAQRIVAQAGQQNGGILFDCWHHHRSGGSPEDVLDIPAGQLFAVQLDDAAAEPMADVMEETLNYRCLPGEGCIDLATTVANLQTVGPEARWDVEVFSEPLRDLSLEARARRLYESTQSVLQRVTHGSK